MQRISISTELPSPEDLPELASSESLVHRTVRAALATASLPAVATLDWCERAASVLAGLEHGAVAGVILAVVTDEGDIRGCEAAGVACARGAMDESMNGALAGLRWRLESMSTLGWKPGQAVDEMGQRGGRLSQMCVEDWNNTHSGRAFSPFAPSELYVGVVDVERRVGAFRMAAWLAHPPSTPVVIGLTDVFLAILQRIGEAASHAIGRDAGQRSVWITAKENQVLDRLILGLCVREIASELGRSVHTVHDHVKSLHRKLGAVSRGDLIARALGYQRSVEYAQRSPRPIAFELKRPRANCPPRPSRVVAEPDSRGTPCRTGVDEPSHPSG